MRLLPSNLSSFMCSHAQGPANKLHAPQTVIVGGDGIGDPRRIGVRVDDPDRGDIVQPALVQQHPVLQRVQANHQVRFQHRSLIQFIDKRRNLSIELIHHAGRAPTKELLPVGESARRPSLEEMTAAGQFSRFDHDSVLPFASTHEKDEACSFSHAGNNAARPPEMGGGHIEGYDMDPLPDTEYIARVPRVPERGRVTEMGLGGEEKFERNLGGEWWSVDNTVWFVMTVVRSAEFPDPRS